MSLEYFYTPPHLISGGELAIEGDEFSHLTHVMRKRVHDRIRVVDGLGHAYEATIAEISRRKALCTVERSTTFEGEPARRVDLAAALLKNSSRFDVLVEKTTEIGVQRIVPLITERTIPRHARTDRWQKLALAAMKQSGRSVLPAVAEPAMFATFVAAVPKEHCRLLAHEKTEKSPIRSMDIPPGTAVTICIGPEGGFTDAEVSAAVAAGFSPVSLGPRRLRTETAAIVALAALVA